jgi:hypothetical protein
MADHNKPTNTSLYSDYTSEINGRFVDITVGLDPASTTATNIPDKAIRFNSANSRWEKYNLSTTTWGVLDTGYEIDLAGSRKLTANSSDAAFTITQTGSGNAFVVEDIASPDSSPFVINADGRVVVGATQIYSIGGGGGHEVQVTRGIASVVQYRSSNNTSAVRLTLGKSRGADVATRGAVINNDGIGVLDFVADDGASAGIAAAQIFAFVDGTPATGSMPGRLVFSTTPSGSASPVERLQIDSAGNVGIGITPTQKLHVSGNILATGSIDCGSQFLGLATDTATAPSFSFTGDTNTGMFRPGTDQVALTTNGVARLTVTTAQFTGTLPWRGQNGTAAAPALSASGDTNTGIYFPAADTIGFSKGGVEAMRIDSSGNVGVGKIAEAGYQLDISNPSTSSGQNTYMRVKSLSTSGDSDAEIILDAGGTGDPVVRLRQSGNDIGYFGNIDGRNTIQISNTLADSTFYMSGSNVYNGLDYAIIYDRNIGSQVYTGITGTITSSAARSTVTGIASTSGLAIGMQVTKTAGTGAFANQTFIYSIDSATQITVESFSGSMTAGSITLTATPTPTSVVAHAQVSSAAWTINAPFARFGFSNSDGSGAGDGGIKASIDAYGYDANLTGAGLDFYVSSNGTTLTKALRLTQTGVYGTTVGATYRTAYIDNTGVLGGLTSLRKAKTNIIDINDTSWLMQLNPVTFNYRLRDDEGNWTDNASSRLEYGLIADDVEEIKPELCIYDNDEDKTGLRGIEYTRLITPMLKLIQQQQEAIQKLSLRIDELEKK